MTGPAGLEERLFEPRGTPLEADLGLELSISALLFASSEALLKWSASTARNAPQVLHVKRRSLSHLSNKCIICESV